MTKSIPAVAFGFCGPDALRVFLNIHGEYHIGIFTGELEELKLEPNQHNIVILPNFAKRHLLEPVADQIGQLVLLTGGRHEAIIEQGIPILDGYLDSHEALQQSPSRTPEEYVQKIREAAVPLPIGAPPAKAAPKKKKRKQPEDLDQWFSLLDKAGCSGVQDFATDIEYPVCQYVVGELSRADLRGALKALVRKDLDNRDLFRRFYRWLTTKYTDAMSLAMRAYLFPESAEKALTSVEVARQFKVEQVDVDLLRAIYEEIQKGGGHE